MDRDFVDRRKTMDQYIYPPLRLTHRQAGELDHSLRARKWPFAI